MKLVFTSRTTMPVPLKPYVSIPLKPSIPRVQSRRFVIGTVHSISTSKSSSCGSCGKK